MELPLSGYEDIIRQVFRKVKQNLKKNAVLGEAVSLLPLKALKLMKPLDLGRL